MTLQAIFLHPSHKIRESHVKTRICTCRGDQQSLRLPEACQVNKPQTNSVQTSATRLVLLTSVWKRPKLTKIVLRTYQQLQQSLADRIELCLLAVGSENDASQALCEEYGFNYVEHPNSPLSYKWNAGVKAAETYNPDGLIIFGSDDLISSEMLRAYAEKLKKGLQFFGVRDMYFFDPITTRLGYWGGYEHTSMKDRSGEPIGCGRCFSRSVLERMDWNLWPPQPKLNSLLDRLSLNYLKVSGFRPVTWRLAEIGASAVDIKIGTNITPFDAIEYQELRQGEQALDYLRPLLTEDDLNLLMQLHDSEAPS